MVARTHPFTRTRISILLVCALLSPAAPADAVPKDPPVNGPKLVVILVVDQMRTDYITKYGANWTRGLHRMVEEGAWFTDAAYPYLNTVTCAGHATISTGTYPATHGMILNAWFDRQSGRMTNCADDRRAEIVSYGHEMTGSSSSAANMRATAFSDVLITRPGNKSSNVVSFSIKPRTAITLGGRNADAVTWFDSARMVWATSGAYTLRGVPFVRSFVEKNPVEKDLGKTWDRSMPLASYQFSDEDAFEKPPAGWTSTFPHEVKGLGKPEQPFYEQWRTTPFADEYLCAMARDAVDRLKLGNKNRTDVLAVSFSALDYVGHDFGPRSHEVQDLLYRLDATIGVLLDHLDKTVGKGNYVVALSADHGVADMPEHVKGDGEEAGRIAAVKVQGTAETVLRKHFGPGRYVTSATYTDLYFGKGVMEKIAGNAAAAQELKEALLAVPGIGWVFSSTEVSGQRESSDPMIRAAALSHYPERSGDWIIIPKKNWFYGSSDATTHGTAHWYDAQVPVIFFGFGVRPGRYSGAVTPADIAPTLAQIVGFKMPAAEGKVLSEGLVPQQQVANGHAH